MKKLLLLSTLIAILPFAANAGNRIGPAQDGSENPVIATESPYYQTAEITTADQTQVVSASYVKGAYNDTIAAINLLGDTKQNVIYSRGTGWPISDTVMPMGVFVGNVLTANDLSQSEGDIVSAAAVAAGIKSQRVTAVDTWGSTHTVDLGLKTVKQ